MLVDTLQLFLGVFLLWGGAELLVRSGSSIALRLGIPVIAVGLIFLGFGTGTPELVVSLKAASLGRGDIAIGNVIGSNVANSSLILGMASFLKPISIKSKLVKHDLPIMVAATLMLSILLSVFPVISRGIGICFIAALIVYTYFAFLVGKEDTVLAKEEEEEIKQFRMKSLFHEVFFLLLGFVILFLGGGVFLNGAISIAKVFDISDAIIGVTIVALGTSLPELAVSIIAVSKKQGDVSIGNIVGSNIFNILGIIGLTSLVAPIVIKDITVTQHLSMSALAIAMWIMARTGWVISRCEGAILLISYVCFICYNVMLVISG
ncbi:MAG: calcium/sodium antiporter [Chlamydiota bacterium]|nr:calcium/sodium antiporter [Chlamydiota bacterium]